MFPHDSLFSSASTEIKQETDAQPEDPEEEFQEQVKVEPEEEEENFNQSLTENRIRKSVSLILSEPHQEESRKNETEFNPEENELICNIKQESLDETEHEEDSTTNDNRNEIYIKETFSLLPLQLPTLGPTCEQICSFCHKKFPTARKLKGHVLVHNKRHECPLCDFKAYSLSKLKRHEVTHTDERPWKCSKPNCQNSYRRKEGLKDHEFSVHGKNFQQNLNLRQQQTSRPALKSCTIFYHCDSCDFFTKNHKQLASHLYAQHNLPRVILEKLPPGLKTEPAENPSVHLDFPLGPSTQNQKSNQKKEREIIHLYKCPEPNCSFSNYEKQRVKFHEFTKHGKRGDLNIHSCVICSYETPQLSRLKIHTDAVHKQLKRFSCHLCDFKTANPSNVKSHVKSVHDKFKRFSCDFCSFKTGRRIYLQRHVQSLHSHKSPFTCLEEEGFGETCTKLTLDTSN